MHRLFIATTRTLPALLAAAFLSACQTGAPVPQVERAAPAEVPLAAGSAEGCWTTDLIPAQTRVVLVPGPEGAQVPRDEVLRPAEQRLFAVPCAEQMTAEVLASLQRALAVRGLYSGPVTGTWTGETADAVRRYQAPQGLDSGVLSLQAAQHLGLIAVSRDRL